MAKTDIRSFVRPLCEELAAQMGYELVDVELVRESAGQYLRIYLDKPGGVDLNDCEAFHRAVHPKLDDVAYDFLEVSSPGLDRPLKTERDFEKRQGETVEVRLYQPVDGQKAFEGELVGLVDGMVVIRSAHGELAFERKKVALVKPVLHFEGLED